MEPGELALANESIEWRLRWGRTGLRATGFVNQRSGRTFAFTDDQELAVVLSGCVERVEHPRRIAEFAVQEAELSGTERAVFLLVSSGAPLVVRLTYELDGPTRRKRAEIENTGAQELLLLDVTLDDFAVPAELTAGGEGYPVLLGDEAFAAIEHPAGWNEGTGDRVRLGHHPGQRLLPGGRLRSHTALVSVAMPGQALSHFVEYVDQRCLRRRGFLSVYTPFGINNQWGACPTLDDEQTLHMLGLLEEWQGHGVRFDYFTLDTGWSDPSSDLKQFRPNCYPDGPGPVVERVRGLGMEFGLWFGTSWGTQSCWDYPPAYPDQRPPGLPYRQGYPLTLGGITFCLGEDRYFQLLRDAVLHHVRENQVRFVKFDGGSYRCDDPAHGHLPGPYSTELMYGRLIDIAAAARAVAPELFVMWYWGLRSPFWALHGDSIFESGLHMEGSGTSVFPALYYRDSVTLAQDQNAHYARAIPPVVKDSLGVWLADTRWGNSMGKERWREALVMDLGRGNMLFPNLWGNLHHLDGDDVRFLARLQALARRCESLFRHRRCVGGDPWKNQVYGYAYVEGRRGLLFLNNAHFAARPVRLQLDESLGLSGRPGATLHVRSHFPEHQQVLGQDGMRLRCGDALDVWLRPFEVLLLEIGPASRRSGELPTRPLPGDQAEELGSPLVLRPIPLHERLAVRFADAERFTAQGFLQQSNAYVASLPSLAGPTPIVAVVVRLRQGEAEWRYSPGAVEIVQVLARIGDRGLPLVPVPDGRQYGNTQKAGCSWVLYKARLGRQYAHQELTIAVHGFVPPPVELRVEAWLVHRWWAEDTRPSPDGYYADAPS